MSTNESDRDVKRSNKRDVRHGGSNASRARAAQETAQRLTATMTRGYTSSSDETQRPAYQMVQRVVRAMSTELRCMYLFRWPADDIQDDYLGILAKLLDVNLRTSHGPSVAASVTALMQVSKASARLAERLLRDYQLSQSVGHPGAGKSVNAPPGAGKADAAT